MHSGVCVPPRSGLRATKWKSALLQAVPLADIKTRWYSLPDIKQLATSQCAMVRLLWGQVRSLCFQRNPSTNSCVHEEPACLRLMHSAES